jgi:hypothetical protein
VVAHYWPACSWLNLKELQFQCLCGGEFPCRPNEVCAAWIASWHWLFNSELKNTNYIMVLWITAMTLTINITDLCNVCKNRLTRHNLQNYYYWILSQNLLQNLQYCKSWMNKYWVFLIRSSAYRILYIQFLTTSYTQMICIDVRCTKLRLEKQLPIKLRRFCSKFKLLNIDAAKGIWVCTDSD